MEASMPLLPDRPRYLILACLLLCPQAAAQRTPVRPPAPVRPSPLPTPVDALPGDGAQQESRPDILIFLVDDIGWIDLEAVPTPNIDRLARRGVSYERFYTMPSCSPTRYQLLFGRYGRRDGIGRIITSYLPPAADNPTPHHELISLPKLAKALGYRTSCIGKWHLGLNFLNSTLESSPHFHGFDDFRAGTMSNLGSGGGSGYYDWFRIDDGFSGLTSEYATAAQRDAAIEWWSAQEGSRFMFMSFSAPHGPYEAPPPEMLPPDWPAPTNARERYRAMTIAVDTAIGQIMEHVDTDNTLVFFISDNGTPRGVAPPGGGGGGGVLDPLGRYKNTTYEGGIRVPMIVSGPGVEEGRVCRGLVNATDVLRTVADVLGIGDFQGPGGEDSVSFLSSFEAPRRETKRTWIFAEQYDDENDDRAVVMERYKLRIFNNRRTIYDLLEDPTEELGIGPNDPRYAGLLATLQDILLNELPPRQ